MTKGIGVVDQKVIADVLFDLPKSRKVTVGSVNYLTMDPEHIY